MSVLYFFYFFFLITTNIYAEVPLDLSKATVADESQIMPPMPVYPEKMVTLSDENRKAVFELSLSNEVQRNRTLEQKRAMAWTIFAAALFFIAIVLLACWFFYEYRRLYPKPSVFVPSPDLEAELKLLEMSGTPLDIRFCKLGQLLRELLAQYIGQDRLSLQGKTAPELTLLLDSHDMGVNIDKNSFKKLLVSLDIVEFSPDLSSNIPQIEQDWHNYIKLLRGLIIK